MYESILDENQQQQQNKKKENFDCNLQGHLLYDEKKINK